MVRCEATFSVASGLKVFNIKEGTEDNGKLKFALECGVNRFYQQEDDPAYLIMKTALGKGSR